MLAPVKRHPAEFVLEGNIPEKYLELLKNDFGKDFIIEEDDEDCGYELASRAGWYKEEKAKETPGGNMKFYRKLHGMTQPALTEKLGTTKQKISNMENGAFSF